MFVSDLKDLFHFPVVGQFEKSIET